MEGRDRKNREKRKDDEPELLSKTVFTLSYTDLL